jgi:hypothetical protein
MARVYRDLPADSSPTGCWGVPGPALGHEIGGVEAQIESRYPARISRGGIPICGKDPAGGSHHRIRQRVARGIVR